MVPYFMLGLVKGLKLDTMFFETVLICRSSLFLQCFFVLPHSPFKQNPPRTLLTNPNSGVLDREGNARKVVNCSCVVVRDWGEESQERSILLNYFQTEQ